MKQLLILIISFRVLLGVAQEPCSVLYGEEPQNRSTTSYTSPEGHYMIEGVVHILYHDTFEGSNINDSITLDAVESLNDDLAQLATSFKLLNIEHHDISEHLLGDLIISGDLCFPATTNVMSFFAQQYSWDNSQYLNIYVIPFSCNNNYGFAYLYPGDENYADAVWVNYRAWGRFGDHLDYARDLNKTVTHEFGHYAGLFHVFQSVSYCGEAHECLTEQDRVCDTAPTKVNFSCTNPICPPGWNSTQPWGAYQHNNHMDYYVDSCRTDFTPGQVERMRWYLSSQRSEAVNIKTCTNDFDDNNVVGMSDLIQFLSAFNSNETLGGSLGLIGLLSEYGNNCNYITL